MAHACRGGTRGSAPPRHGTVALGLGAGRPALLAAPMNRSSRVRAMSAPLAGRRALVTGAATGIGRATARRLPADGPTVAINYLGPPDQANGGGAGSGSPRGGAGARAGGGARAGPGARA